MKKAFFFLIYMMTVVASAVAQPRFTANVERHDFGQIEWKQPVTARYVVTNTGDRPLVLTQVEPDCACTVASWTTTPIAPGEQGTVEVTYDAQALGRFHRGVTVWTNAEPHLVYLYMTGRVMRQVKDFARTHPYQIGTLRIDRDELAFPDVQQGEKRVLQVGVVNLSERPYEPILMHLPRYLQAEAQPAVLQPGERGIIKVTLDSDKLSDLGLTQSSVYLSRFSGDKVGSENELPVSAVLLPDFSKLTEAERLNPPSIQLSQDEIDFRSVLSVKKKARQDVLITNKGKTPLHISKLQVFHPSVGVSLKKSVLQPGESTRLRVTVRKRGISKHRRHLRLLMITNDPSRPKVEINIKAE